jgi:hypothetical protein
LPRKRLKLTASASSKEEIEEHNDIVGKDEVKPPGMSFKEYENDKISTLEDIFFSRVRQNFYFSIEQVYDDIHRIVLQKLKNGNDYMTKYCNHFLNEAWEVLEKGKKGFINAVTKDWTQCLLDNQNAVKVENWDREPHPSRNYQAIEDYVPYNSKDTSSSKTSKSSSNGDSTKSALFDRLKTQKEGSCDGLHCGSLEHLGPLDLSEDTWKSQCSDRYNKVECSGSCRCSEEKCMNRQISLKQGMKLGVDVEERETWGFDSYTYRNIMGYLRQPLNDDFMYIFISKSLPRAINQCTSNNWDIRNALKLILEQEGEMFTLRDMRYAHCLLNAINGLSALFGTEAILDKFRIHPKGTGVICTRKQGISQNQFIIEYLGELYTPSKWYEKQDIIKHLLNKQKRQDQNSSGEQPLPDFYNIILERHPSDSKGYDLMMVDPIVKGNFGSRLSHCCTPNCGTVTMVANERYTIGMYALSKIEWGEELTFDYNSVTESSDEQRKAVCLCGSSMCRRYYLALDKSASGMGVTFEAYNFLDRMAALLKACDNLEITEDRNHLLECFSIKDAVLKDAPDWLKSWTCMVLKSVSEELEIISDPYNKRFTKESRIQNLVITIDKVKYCLNCLTNSDVLSSPPPMALFNSSEVLAYLWGEDNFSIKNQLKFLITQNPDFLKLFSDSPQQQEIINNLSIECTDIYHAKCLLLAIRDLLRELDPINWITSGIADILHLLAFTHIFFRENQYPNFVSEPVEIRYCDLMKVPPKDKIFSDVYGKESKKYSSTHIQGTLIGWFKQTVEKPGASLSADKRGPVTISSIYYAKEGPYTSEVRFI